MRDINDFFIGVLAVERIIAVAELTLVRLREPAFMMLMLLAAVIGWGTSEMGAFSFEGDSSILAVLLSTSYGRPVLACFMAVLMATLIMAVFIGATDIPRDIESGMVMVILAKPVNRLEYVLGKYVGVMGICLAFFLVASLGIIAGHVTKTGEWFSLGVLARQAFSSLVIFPFAAITVAISTFLRDIGAMIATVLYISLAMVMASAAVLLEMLPRGLEGAPFAYASYFLFPNFLHYFHSFRLSGLVPLALAVYTLCLTAIFLGVAVSRLASRDMV